MFFLAKWYRPNLKAPFLCCSLQIGFFSVRKFYDLLAQQSQRGQMYKTFGLINSLTFISLYSGDHLFERFWQSGTDPNPKAPLLFCSSQIGFYLGKNSQFAFRALIPWSNVQNILA
jgi:hypothetical protein